MTANYVQPVIDRLRAELPDCDLDLIRFYALLALVKGPETTLEDVHDAWAIYTNQTRPGHRSLVPFGQLSTEVQELDRPYRDAIRAALSPDSKAPQSHSAEPAPAREDKPEETGR